MGCDPYSIKHTEFTLGHPSSSCTIGEIVDANLETKIRNLFVCDNSAMPGAPSRPPVLTIVTLAKYFLQILLKRLYQM
jgi:choline dehydrogenase-like flavoprotein